MLAPAHRLASLLSLICPRLSPSLDLCASCSLCAEHHPLDVLQPHNLPSHVILVCSDITFSVASFLQFQPAFPPSLPSSSGFFFSNTFPFLYQTLWGICIVCYLSHLLACDVYKARGLSVLVTGVSQVPRARESQDWAQVSLAPRPSSGRCERPL